MRELTEAEWVRLIVWDNTPHQIPWELYYLHEPKDERRSVWLGSVVEIARWTSLLRGPDAVYDAELCAANGRMLLLEMGAAAEALSAHLDRAMKQNLGHTAFLTQLLAVEVAATEARR
jgi:hypothetical protein